eukprot:scaffold156785_cov76-Attheya_sp.AAC.3
MEEVQVQDNTGGSIQLNTFHGPNTWAAFFTNQVVFDAILKSTASTGQPFFLAMPSITDTSVNVSIDVSPGIQNLEK